MKVEEILNLQVVKDLNVKIVQKDKSILMRILGFFIRIFNKDFDKLFTVTLGNTIYAPIADKISTSTLWHEIVHIYDRQNLNKKCLKLPIYELGYLFPQILAIFSFLAFFNLWFLLFLLFLLPLPAPFRTIDESHGYAMTIFCNTYNSKSTSIFTYAEDLAKRLFITSLYYFMWPFLKSATNRICSDYYKLKSKHPIFIEAQKMLQKDKKVNSW